MAFPLLSSPPPLNPDATTRSVDDLIHDLGATGRHADPDLIAECVERESDLMPRLLEVFRDEMHPDFEDDVVRGAASGRA